MSGLPPMEGYRPYGVPGGRRRESIVMLFEEFEAIRLADYENLTQEEAAKRMNISRPTFTRLYDKARKVVARAFVESKAIEIRGGHYSLEDHWYRCRRCHQVHASRYPTDRCLSCNSEDIIVMGPE